MDKKSNIKSTPKKHLVCSGCKDTLDIKVAHDENLPDWNTCYGCNKILWCLSYLF